MTDFAARNREWWDERVPAHVGPNRYYACEQFETDAAFLSREVRVDQPLLGDLTGLYAIHLQCHIGVDTISLSRLGANATGLDFSPIAIAAARDIAAKAGADVRFVEGDVHDAVDILGAESFDLVYSSVGSLQYLPRIRDWASVVARLLRPGGRLFMREAHPMVWALRDVGDDRLVVDGAYFEVAEPERFDRPDTYAVAGSFTTRDSYEWNHGLGEIVTALLASGLQLTSLVEYDTAVSPSFPGMERVGEYEFRLIDRPERLPLTYSLQAVRPLSAS